MTDVDTGDVPAAVCMSHRQQESVADCALLLGKLRRACMCIVMCVRWRRREVKINGSVFGCVPGEHLHQSQPSRCSPRLMQTRACWRQERLKVQKNFLIIGLQFLHFPCVCVCVRAQGCVCPAVYEILLYIPSFPHHNKFIILNKVIFKVTSWLEFLLKSCLSFDFLRKIQFGLQINTCMYSLLLSSEGVQALSSLLRRACRGNQRLS